MTPDEFNARVIEIDAACDLAVRRVACSSSTFDRHPQLVLYDGRVEAAYRKRDRDTDALEAEFYGC